MNNAIVVFSNFTRSEAQEDYIFAADWEDFLYRDKSPCGFWIAASWNGDIPELVKNIRQSAWWDRFIFTENTCDDVGLDGSFSQTDALYRGLRAEAAKASLQLDIASLDRVEKLLLYLYLREGFELAPKLEAEAKTLYCYPLIRMLGLGDDTGDWLATLVRRRFLEPMKLLDRVRLCLHCGSAHIYFVDVCPNCSSIEIEASPALHCFTCGHVARQSNFEVEGGLVCPKCNARLRHIGVDYDRPMTQYGCSTCHHLFIEAQVIARCVHCGAKDDPGKLDVVEIHSLRLSSVGRGALRMKQVHESFSALDNANYVVPPFFKQMVSWAAVTQERHKELIFGLILVEFLNPDEIVNGFGATRAYLMLDEFARRLREFLRASDVTTRTTEERLWLFLPFTTPDGVASRLNKLINELQPEVGPKLKINLRVFYAPRDILKGDTADSIMQRM